MTDGGEGVAGLKWSEESRKKLSNSKTGKPHFVSEEHKRHLSEAMIREGIRPPIWACRKGGLVPNPPVTEQARENYRKAWVSRKERGWSPSAETREKMAAAKRGTTRVFSEEHRNNISKAAKENGTRPPDWACSLGGKSRKGIPRSEETKQKISKSLTGKTLTLEHKMNLSNAHLGTKMPPWTEGRRLAARASWTEERRIQAAETARKVNTGRKASDETKKKLSEAHTEIPQSLESRQKKSESLKRFYAAKKIADETLVGAA